MKGKKILPSLMIGATVFTMTFSNVLANTHSYEGTSQSNPGYDLNTSYQSNGYEPPLAHYDVDLSWDDLSWIYVYTGDISDPDNHVWMSVDRYNNLIAYSQDDQMTNDNIAMFFENDDYLNQRYSDVEIQVTNNSYFSVNVAANVEDKTNSESNYTSQSEIQIGVFGDNGLEGSFAGSATISNLTSGSSKRFLVGPSSDSYVNTTGESAQVTGEVKLTFSQYN